MDLRTRMLFTLLLMCGVFNSYSQDDTDEGLVAYYPFNGNPNDASGNGHNGVLVNGPALTADRFGNPNSAYHFDGKNDYIRITDNGDFSTPLISLAFWYKTESLSLQNIIAKRRFADDGTPGGGAQYQFFINHATLGKIASNLVGDQGNCNTKWVSNYIKTFDPLCIDKWHFVVVTYDGTHHKVFINGKLRISDKTTFNGFSRCKSELRIGNWWQLDMLPFKGDFDEFRWYNRALTQQEINALYDNFKPQGHDFTIKRNPGSTGISLKTKAINYKSITWDFGDGKVTRDTDSAQHTYADFGTYTVKMILFSGNCADTIKKQVTLETATKPSSKKITPASQPKGQTAQISKPKTDTISKAVSVASQPKKISTLLPLVLRERENALIKKIETEAGEIKIRLYDNGEIDGDTVSIYHNNVLIRSHQLLSQKPISFTISIDPSQSHHELVMVAENLGSIPPNTSLMIITTANDRYELMISSSEQKNAKVVFDLKK